MGGSAYADIDVLACAVSYKQCLRLKGCDAFAITGPWNQTIPPHVRNWPIDVDKNLHCSGCDYHYVLVDFSDPQYIDPSASLNSVVEVFDHHWGFENYWSAKIGKKAKIEKVGACATLIWEEFKHAGLDDKITSVNANLLYTAIFANTLNFRSAVTHARDRGAAEEILPYTLLPSNWHKQYYDEIENEFLQNTSNKIMEDTKIISFGNITFNFGQVEMANASQFLRKSLDSLITIGSRVDENNNKDNWIVNIVSIEEGCSYLYSNCNELIAQLKRISSPSTWKEMGEDGVVLATNRLWLRKELLREILSL
jgi:inorganic pyrophosphatase/exopolyphosphatase